MADPNRATRMKTAFKIVAGLAVIAAVACWTNPPHFRHVSTLFGPAEASKRWELNAEAKDTAVAGNRPFQLPLEGASAPETRYHDYYLVSTTSVDGGGVVSIGLFRFVIDLRSKP